MTRPKVFGIGFHKTGTSSLASALRRLGYTVTGPNGVDDPRIAVEALAMCLDLAHRFDGFQDNPWPILFREMDEAFPGSRFILTTRPADAWIKSVVRHFHGKSTPMREWIYGPGNGDPEGKEALYVERFERHEREVLAYFADRPQDLLVLPLASPMVWAPLCGFLEHPEPEEPYPHENPGSSWTRVGVAMRWLRERLGRV